MCVLAITMLLVMPTDAQVTKKTKKKPKATIEEDYQSPDNNYLIGQKGVLKKFPEKLDVKRVIKNRNKKAKYTFYAADKKKLTISKISELLKMHQIVRKEREHEIYLQRNATTIRDGSF